MNNQTTEEYKDKTIERRIVEEITEFFPMMNDRFVRRIEREKGFTPLQYAAMDMLRIDGPKSMKQISDKLRMSKQQLTRFINVFVNRGLMRRYQKKDNRRIIYIELTEEGEKQLADFSELKLQERMESIKLLSNEDKVKLLTACRDFNTILHKVWKNEDI